MKRIKLALVAASVAAFGLFGIGGTAQAMNCNGLDNGDLQLSPACAVAASVICKVVAKGQPCLA